MFRIDFNKLRFLGLRQRSRSMRRILRTLHSLRRAPRFMRPRTAPPPLEMCHHYVPDIVITDWTMPKIFNELELTQMIRQPEVQKGMPYAPIIMLTGHSEKRRVTVARDAGVAEFLAKPISRQGPLPARPKHHHQSPAPPSRPRPISVRTGAATPTPPICGSERGVGE